MLERMWRKGDPPALLVGYKLIQSLWRMVERYLKKKKKRNKSTIWSNNSNTSIYPEKTTVPKQIDVPQGSLQHYLQQPGHGQPKCPSTYEWIKKILYIHAMEYYSVTKKNKFKSVLMRWMNLESVTQSEISQKEKNKYPILIHIYGIYW